MTIRTAIDNFEKGIIDIRICYFLRSMYRGKELTWSQKGPPKLKRGDQDKVI